MNVIGFIVGYFAIGLVLCKLIFPWLIVHYLHKHQREQKISDEIYDQYSEDFHENLEMKENLMDPVYKLKSALQLYLLWPYELPRRAIRTLNHEMGVLSAYKEDEE